MFHTHDVLLAHMHPNSMTENTKLLDRVCGLVDPLEVTRGKHHENLGMKLDFATVKKACAIMQHDVIEKLYVNLIPELNG